MSDFPYRIDVHHHFLPAPYMAVLHEQGVTTAGGNTIPEWSPDISLGLMERMGVATAILSITEPGLNPFSNTQQARSIARACNEYAAELLVKHPGRFGAFAILPLPDMEAALDEVQYALDTLHLDGVSLLSNYNGRYPGDPFFDELFTELNRRKAVIHVHPSVPPPGATRPQFNLSPSLLEFVFDTTRTAANLIFSATLERCPDLRIILSHGGGTLPYIQWRLASVNLSFPTGKGKQQTSAPEPDPAFERMRTFSLSIAEYIQQFYYDTTMSPTAASLCSLQKVTPLSHILFGSDNGFAPERYGQAMKQELEMYDGFDMQARRAVEHENALALFPRLR